MKDKLTEKEVQTQFDNYVLAVKDCTLHELIQEYNNSTLLPKKYSPVLRKLLKERLHHEIEQGEIGVLFYVKADKPKVNKRLILPKTIIN